MNVRPQLIESERGEQRVEDEAPMPPTVENEIAELR
jgi:hypothetical protein